MKILLRKIDNNLATVRDYQVEWCLQKKEDLILECNKEQILIPYNFIKTAGVKRKVEYTSKFDGKKYGLIDFYWTPKLQGIMSDTIKVDNQQKLF